MGTYRAQRKRYCWHPSDSVPFTASWGRGEFVALLECVLTGGDNEVSDSTLRDVTGRA